MIDKPHMPSDWGDPPRRLAPSSACVVTGRACNSNNSQRWCVTCTNKRLLHIYESEDVTLHCTEFKQCRLLFKLRVIYNVIV
jgi:hypothetical protein